MWTNAKKAWINVTLTLTARTLRVRIHAIANQVILETDLPVKKVRQLTVIKGKKGENYQLIKSLLISTLGGVQTTMWKICVKALLL